MCESLDQAILPPHSCHISVRCWPNFLNWNVIFWWFWEDACISASNRSYKCTKSGAWSNRFPDCMYNRANQSYTDKSVKDQVQFNSEKKPKKYTLRKKLWNPLLLQSHIWLSCIYKGMELINRLTCIWAIVQVWIWFHKENTQETKFLHSARDLHCSTVNREYPGQFKDFCWECRGPKLKFMLHPYCNLIRFVLEMLDKLARQAQESYSVFTNFSE